MPNRQLRIIMIPITSFYIIRIGLAAWTLDITTIVLSVSSYMCNELGGGRRRLIRFTPRTKKHTPVMVYDDLMIRNNTLLSYNINRSRPVTVQ